MYYKVSGCMSLKPKHLEKIKNVFQIEPDAVLPLNFL